MLNEGEAYFGLFGGDFDPAALSIGVTPTKTRRKGNPKPKYSAWIYSIGERKAEVLDISEMASALVASLEPCVEKIIAAKQTYGLKAVLEVVLTFTPDETKSTPVIGFDSNVIAFLHRVGASIDIDTYRGA